MKRRQAVLVLGINFGPKFQQLLCFLNSTVTADLMQWGVISIGVGFVDVCASTQESVECRPVPMERRQVQRGRAGHEDVMISGFVDINTRVEEEVNHFNVVGKDSIDQGGSMPPKLVVEPIRGTRGYALEHPCQSGIRQDGQGRLVSKIGNGRPFVYLAIIDVVSREGIGAEELHRELEDVVCIGTFCRMRGPTSTGVIEEWVLKSSIIKFALSFTAITTEVVQ
jgi:hypothetical protein